MSIVLVGKCNDFNVEYGRSNRVEWMYYTNFVKLYYVTTYSVDVIIIVNISFYLWYSENR